jgi:hypothetical protein
MGGAYYVGSSLPGELTRPGGLPAARRRTPSARASPWTLTRQARRLRVLEARPLWLDAIPR